MPPRSGKISSALNAFESTIQKNAESGEHCGMYISNKVGKKGGLSRSSHHGTRNNCRREASRSPSRRREGGRRSSSRSPTREASRVRGGTRSVSKSPPRRRREEGNRSSSRSPSRHRSSSNPRIGRASRSASRSPSRHRISGGNRSSSKSPSRQRSSEPVVNEARRAAERLKKRADNSKMHGRPRRRERPSTSDLNLNSPNRRSNNKASDQSNLTDTTGELTIEVLERPGAASSRRGWNSFEESANFFSEAESSVGGDVDDDSFSVISESTFEQPEWNPEVKKKKKQPIDPNASWASGFAVSYQQRNDESESEDDERRAKEPRSPRKDRSSRHSHRPLKKSGSSRNMQKPKASGFAITYQHRNEESDSDFDALDMREKIRKKQQKASGGPTLERMGSFKLTRSASSNSLGGGGGVEDLNSMSCSALNTVSLHSRKQSGDGFGNMVVGDPSSFHASFLGGDDRDLLGVDDDVEPSFDNLQNTKMHGTTSRQGDASAFGSSAPKPARPARKYGAAAAAENMANLPPAFQTMARKQICDKNGQPRRHHGSSRPHDRRPRPHKENSAMQTSEEMDNAFSTDRSFFDCV